MPNTTPPITSVKALEQYRKIAEKKSIVDYGVYIGATGKNREEIKNAADACGVKVYMGSTTGELLVADELSLSNSFAAAKEAGKIVCVHAEDEGRIRRRTASVKRKSKVVGPEVHSVIRDVECARLAVEKAVKHAKTVGNMLHVCHVSSKAELSAIAQARKTGIPVSCEVAPHHLFLSEGDYSNSSLLKVNPPLRSRSDVSALWGALQEGFIDCVASDHAPHLLAEKEEDYWNAPAGLPGLETMLPLMLDAVAKRMLPLQRAVALTSGNPARIFGLKNKGSIEDGFDADLVLVDFRNTFRIRGDSLKTRCRWTPFEGRTVTGIPRRTIVRGTTVFLDGETCKGGGRMVAAR
jgi:dihydroorotase